MVTLEHVCAIIICFSQTDFLWCLIRKPYILDIKKQIEMKPISINFLLIRNLLQTKSHTNYFQYIPTSENYVMVTFCWQAMMMTLTISTMMMMTLMTVMMMMTLMIDGGLKMERLISIYFRVKRFSGNHLYHLNLSESSSIFQSTAKKWPNIGGSKCLQSRCTTA